MIKKLTTFIESLAHKSYILASRLHSINHLQANSLHVLEKLVERLIHLMRMHGNKLSKLFQIVEVTVKTTCTYQSKDLSQTLDLPVVQRLKTL